MQGIAKKWISSKGIFYEKGGQKKDHLVKWRDAVKSKKQSGLGLGRLKERNSALIGK